MPDNKPERSSPNTNGFKSPYKLLIDIQRDTLESLTKILVKLQDISDGVKALSKDEKEEDVQINTRLFRIIYFLIGINAIFAGIKIGEITGLWKTIF